MEEETSHTGRTFLGLLEKEFDKLIIVCVLSMILGSMLYLSAVNPQNVMLDWLQQSFSALIGALTALMTSNLAVSRLLESQSRNNQNPQNRSNPPLPPEEPKVA